MIVVTGAAGFIGSNIIQGLNAIGITDIIAVDDLRDGKKFQNLAAVKFYDYLDHQDFLKKIQEDYSFASAITTVFHEGACSDTLEWNGQYMMQNNYDYSKILLHYCLQKKIQFIYASSAAVYGANTVFNDQEWGQMPLNVYGYSKWLFDCYVKSFLKNPASQIVGLRYFNVFGPRENHKGKMASVAFHLMDQLKNNGVVKLFSAYGGYGDGAHERDFIYVDDVVKVNLWFFQHSKKNGIYNCGTGQARAFNDIAKKLIALQGSGKLEYISFPDALKGSYQCFTQANITALREAGYAESFLTLEEGLSRYYLSIKNAPTFVDA
ncbi:MAG: hypothetical protein ACD_70C00097G0001 [uncultured bacterium]|nr:MAG: hypothetical protein ACD_70C00097G0001 [uncultured bacterium]OGT26657.1 MAG: ADP-glyceromanno-heptose 6-epimerase [Gammaproteobacteria bacterium RIFCSPHIGHO2_02_FULL_42_43]OGT27740.1 MAG: ADP-glyceromanno-heptose 6-epimerase [Gammaproteobacteria bacterium RIFCSPHIGHO2_01_FULL_42_8]OGT53037.1 MAG: ADP-glyceromanno-heptose 6-epimerase [Gammaproteobacteria bacterium RIFCSPHIGHO2_12_FULL_41_25]OGT61190.1 MAG: ADP-glyceromanno-heptose 6-epimerase [Gammaproteobacteria bacterium RIFCSPLOWO2_02